MALRQFRPHSWLATLLLLLAVAPFHQSGTNDSPVSSSGLLANALPVTSKPIDGSPQNAAWGDWVVLTAAQQQNTKSRKVTPKSIFTLPFRQCPEGHTLSESRCIPVVKIDSDQLLKDQLSLFGGNDPNGNNDQPVYDYGDYGDDGSMQLPLRGDEPLKVSIFQKFPANDYPAEGSGSGPVAAIETAEPSAAAPPEPEATETTGPNPAPVINVTQILQQISDYLKRHGQLPTNENLFGGDDLNAASSQITTTATQPPEEGFSIDAIVVPAGGPKGETAAAADLEPQRAASQLHRVSLFKDVQQQDIASLLKVDSLLPLRSANLTQSAVALRLEQPSLLLGLGEEADSTVSPTTSSDQDETDTTDFQMDDSFFSSLSSTSSDQSLAGGGVTQPHEHEALRLAAEEERQRRRGGQHMVLKKSKVEPVGEQEPHGSSTASPPATTSPLPAATQSDEGDATANRFHYQHMSLSHEAADLGNAETGASTDTTTAAAATTTDSTTIATSTGEINIEQELRAINQLVKGKRQPDGEAAATSENTTTDGGASEQAKPAGQQVTAEAIATTMRTTAATDDEEKSTLAETEPSSSTVSDTTSTVTDDEITSHTTMGSDGVADTTSSSSSSSTVSPALSPSSPEATTTTNEENATTMSLPDETATSSTASGPSAESTDSTTMSTAVPTKMESSRDGNEISSSVDPSVTTTIPTPTIWSKIMPILGSDSTPDGVPAGEKPSKRIDAADMGTSLLFTFRGNSVGAVEQDAQSTGSSRRNRNSKIRKFDETLVQSTPMDEESSSVESTVDSGHHQTASTMQMASTMFSEASTTGQTTQTTTTTGTTTTTDASTTTTPPSSASSTTDLSDDAETVDSYEPFWWLPLGWSLSGAPSSSVEAESQDSEVLPPDDSSSLGGGEAAALDSNSLLLRLWSSLPGNHIRARA